MADNLNTKYTSAVEAIKTAILQGQYEAAKGVNRIQLAVYFGIGKYISLNTRKGVWGTGALKIISDRLQKELPGLRGYSENSLKNMRKFYEEWQMLDANSTIAIVDLQKSNSTTTVAELQNTNSAIAIAELQSNDYQIDIQKTITIPDVKDFPIEDFFNLPFTHHIRIIEKVKNNLSARYYYIHRAVEEHLQEDRLKQLIASKAFENQDKIPNNFSKTISDSSLARKAVMMFKDEYLLNFINVEQIGERDAIDVDERVVEQQIVQNIKEFKNQETSRKSVNWYCPLQKCQQGLCGVCNQRLQQAYGRGNIQYVRRPARQSPQSTPRHRTTEKIVKLYR